MHPAIERLQRLCAASPDVLSLGGGLPAPELFPEHAIARATIAALRRPAVALQYGWPEGDRRLRAWIAARARRGGIDVDADAVIVTSGGQQAIALATDVLLRSGDRIGVDPETYPAALDLFRTRGVLPVAAATAVQAHYVMPVVSNPRGTALTALRRAALLAAGVPILADEAYTELAFEPSSRRPMASEAPDRVWQIGSFSKTLCPGLRIGWLIPPARHREATLQVKHDVDLQASSLGQSILVALLPDFDFDRHLATARALYARRADALVSALRRMLPRWRVAEPRGGFSVFAEADERAGDDAQLLALATQNGVSFDPGRLFRASEASEPLAMRLCFCNLDERRIEAAVQRLARAWDAFRPSVRRTG